MEMNEVNEEVSITDNNAQTTYNFDEVEQLTSTPEEKSDVELVKEAMEGKEEKEAPQGDAVEAKSEEEKDGEIKEEKDPSEEIKEEEVKEEIKKILGKFGEENLEIPANAVFKHTVDGQEVEVPLQELLNNYSGKIPWDRKYTELSKEKKEYQEQVSAVNNYINGFRDIIQKGDMEGALSYFAEFAGQNPLEFKKALRESLSPKFEQYNKMSEDQRRLLDIQEENKFLKEKQESELKQRQAYQSQQEVELRLQKIQETHNMTQEDLEQNYKELAENFGGDKVTPEMIGEYHVRKSAYQKAEALLTSIDPIHVQNEVTLDNMANLILKYPDNNDQDWNAILEQAFGKKVKKSSKSEVLTKKVSSSSGREASNSARADKNVLTFDDL